MSLARTFSRWAGFLLIALSLRVYAESYSGQLFTDGGADTCALNTAAARYDWFSPGGGFEKDRFANDGTIRLQSRVIWQGSGPISDDEHAGVAYTQDHTAAVFNSPSQPGDCQRGWNYGAGAFVRDDGLSIELWQIPTFDTIIWNLTTPCGAYVQKSGSPNLCLPIISLDIALDSNPPQSYITDLQQLTLLREHVYWIRIGLADESGEWISITAELFDESTLIQMARINFVLGQVLPIYGPLSGTAFRTAPGMPYENIWIDLFDYF